MTEIRSADMARTAGPMEATWPTSSIEPTSPGWARHVPEFLMGDFSASPLVQNARALVPAIKERSERQQQQGWLLDETVADMQAAGLFQMLQPKRYGGAEATPIESFEATATLAEADPSVGWVLGVIGIHALHLAMFDDRAQAEVWASDPKTLVSSPYAPCDAERVPGGYRLSGRWSFSSGSDLCDWTFLGARVPGEPVPPMGAVGSHVFLLPRSDYEVVHNWDVFGLRATGSNDILVKDAFVPDYRTLRWQDVEDGTAPGYSVNTGALFRLPFFQVFSRATQPPTALGALKGMADSLVEFCRTRRRNAKDPALTLALARSYSEIDEMKGRLYANYAALIAQSQGTFLLGPGEEDKFRFQAARVASRCAALGTELLRVAGGTSVYDTEPFGRYLADLLVTQTHALNNFQARAVDWIAPVLERESA